jgi:hypothetical protein
VLIAPCHPQFPVWIQLTVEKAIDINDMQKLLVLVSLLPLTLSLFINLCSPSKSIYGLFPTEAR